MQAMADADLQTRNTLAVSSRADRLLIATSVDEVADLIKACKHQRLHVLGGGSNVLLPPRIRGVVLTPAILGKQVLSQDNQSVRVRVGAGEDWHQWVDWALQRGFYGLENLALIPGTVGAAPVQNIGAYGAEVGDFIESLELVERKTGALERLSHGACAFGYRDSVFKGPLRERYVITHVVFQLRRQPSPNLGYPALIEALGQEVPTPEMVFAAVCRLRRQRLPDPARIPNCGSFFKNPMVTAQRYDQLRQRFPDLVAFAAPGGVKLAAAWLIDRAGWKGKARHGVAVHERQALVLTNPQRRSAAEVLALADDIREDVRQRYGVALELEPQRLGWQ